MVPPAHRTWAQPTGGNIIACAPGSNGATVAIDPIFTYPSLAAELASNSLLRRPCDNFGSASAGRYLHCIQRPFSRHFVTAGHDGSGRPAPKPPAAQAFSPPTELRQVRGTRQAVSIRVNWVRDSAFDESSDSSSREGPMNCSERPIGAVSGHAARRAVGSCRAEYRSAPAIYRQRGAGDIPSAAADSPAREGGHRCNLDRLPNHSRCFRWSQR